MSKFEGLIWRIAKGNSRLNKELYKEIIRRSPFLKRKISLRDFKEAFHSKSTKNEHRALLLSSLYNSRSLRDFVLQDDPKRNARNISFIIQEKNGIKSLSLVAQQQVIDRWGVYKFKTVTHNLSPTVKSNLKLFHPWKNERAVLTKALLSGSAQAQKSALLIEQASTFLHSLADLIATNIRLNDPKKVYFSKDYSPNEDDDDLLDPLPVRGQLQRTQTKFFNHLQHMKKEFNKFKKLLEKVGIDTSNLQEWLNILSYNVGIFIESDFQSYSEEVQKLYVCFDRSITLLEEIQDMAHILEDTDLRAPGMFKMYLNEVVPVYEPYSERDRHYVKTNTPGTVVEKMTQILEMFK